MATGPGSTGSRKTATSVSRPIRAASSRASCAIISGIDAAALGATVFPDTGSLAPAAGLVRA